MERPCHRDASTCSARTYTLNKEKDIDKIIRDRTKTGEPLYIPVPKDVAEEVIAALNGNPVYVFWNRPDNSSCSTMTSLASIHSS